MDVRIELTGTTPLVCHNPQLADPDSDISVQIRALTGKRKKTEEDRKAVSKLEWFGGLYLDDKGRPVIPCDAIKRCIEVAATMSREGKVVQRGLAMKSMLSPIIYDGPKKIEDLWEAGGFVDRCTVVVGGKRIVRTRPTFPRWVVMTEAMVVTDKMDLRALESIVRLAGSCVGIGDKRVKGYGRFEAKVVPV